MRPCRAPRRGPSASPTSSTQASQFSLQVRAPVSKGESVVLAQVLRMPYVEPDVLHGHDDPSGPGDLSVWEDVAVDEGLGFHRARIQRPGDRVVQQAAAGAQSVLQGPEIRGVVLDPDVFGQADRGNRVEPAFRNIPVIQVPNFGNVLQTFVDDRFLAPFGLLPGQCEPRACTPRRAAWRTIEPQPQPTSKRR